VRRPSSLRALCGSSTPASARLSSTVELTLSRLPCSLGVCDVEGLKVNSLEEYPYNRELPRLLCRRPKGPPLKRPSFSLSGVFAGRNWCAGEVVELVLRRPNGSFFPTSWLLSVLCHELAHIKHMNHGPGFHKYNGELRQQVAQLRGQGYYGEGRSCSLVCQRSRPKAH
jgi:hypothetical protein